MWSPAWNIFVSALQNRRSLVATSKLRRYPLKQLFAWSSGRSWTPETSENHFNACNRAKKPEMKLFAAKIESANCMAAEAIFLTSFCPLVFCDYMAGQCFERSGVQRVPKIFSRKLPEVCFLLCHFLTCLLRGVSMKITFSEMQKLSPTERVDAIWSTSPQVCWFFVFAQASKIVRRDATW